MEFILLGIIFLLWLFAGSAKSGMDTLVDHYKSSVFADIRDERKKAWWAGKTTPDDSKYNNVKFWMKDGWHFLSFLQETLQVISLYIMGKLAIMTGSWIFVVGGTLGAYILYSLAFNVTYEYFYYSPSKRPGKFNKWLFNWLNGNT